MQYTKNLNLKKPEDNDKYDQEHINSNMDTLDGEVSILTPFFGAYDTFPTTGIDKKLYIDNTVDPQLMYTWNETENKYVLTGGAGGADGSSVDIPLTLLSTAWTGTTAPYSQTVTVPQMREDMTPFVTLTDSDTLTDATRYAFSLLTDYDAGYAQMTFYAADKPTVDIPVTLKGIPAQEPEFVDNTVVLIVEPSGFTLSTDPEYDGRYVSTIAVEGMSAGAEGASWDIVRSGPVLTLEESKIAASITDVKPMDGAVQIVCMEVPAATYLLKITGSYADAAPGDVILPNIQPYLDKVDELEAANTFSYDEVKIGKWVDGKPLYRKVIDTVLDWETSENYEHKNITLNITDIKYIIKINIFIHNSSGLTIYPIPFFDGTGAVQTFINHAENGEIDILNKAYWKGYKLQTIVEYTKTTD